MPSVRQRLSTMLASKFQQDALWNFGSVGVLALCGYAMNLLIGRYYGSAALGVFNQVMVPYIFLSQLAAGGVNLSALRAIAQAPYDRPRVSAIILGALPPTLVLTSLCCAIFWFGRHWYAARLDSPDVALGIEVAVPGLFFFGLNKVGMSVVNGVRRMRAFALYTSLRYVLIPIAIFIAMATELPAARLSYLWSFSEAIVFLALSIEIGSRFVRPAANAWRKWSREHLRYGMKSVVSGMLLELNARVDVVMLGLWLTDDRVGVYSFAAFVAEGLFQILIVLQNNYNPVIAEHLAAGKLEELHAIVAKGRKVTYLLMTGAAVLAVAGYPVFLVLLDKPEFHDGWLPFAVIALGMTIASGYMPFAQTLLMANRPGWQTLLMCSIVLCNVIGNWILIPILGLVGAATATAFALVCSMFVLKSFVRRQVGLRL